MQMINFQICQSVPLHLKTIKLYNLLFILIYFLLAAKTNSKFFMVNNNRII